MLSIVRAARAIFTEGLNVYKTIRDAFDAGCLVVKSVNIRPWLANGLGVFGPRPATRVVPNHGLSTTPYFDYFVGP